MENKELSTAKDNVAKKYGDRDWNELNQISHDICFLSDK